MRSNCARWASCLAVALAGGVAHGAEPAGGGTSKPGPAVEAAPAKPAEKAAPKAGQATGDRPEAAPPDLGPGQGQGERKVAAPGGSAGRAAAQAETPGRPKAEPPAPTHQRGRAPKQPSATLPPGVPEPSPDASSRRLVAGGPTADELSQPKADPELRDLSTAERVLFPAPLPGARAGWSWVAPELVDDGPVVEATGLPSGVQAGSAPARRAAVEGWLAALALPNLPARMDARVVKYLKFYREDSKGKNILRVWVRRSGRLVPALKAEFAKAGLPTDLVWLSLIESAHNPLALSPAGAAGLWQFIPETARMYGLTVDRWVDERLDPERSTQAAVRYLTDLHARFGTWELAMAAYNMGHGGLLRAVRKFNTNDFWGLSRYEAGIPWETTLYVPKIVATAIAMNNKKAFAVDDVELEPSLSFDVVSVGPGTDLAEVARAADASVDEVRSLNAHYLAQRTPPSTRDQQRYAVRVPSGRGVLAEQRLSSTAGRRGREPHIARLGDSIATLAQDYGVDANEMARLNQLTTSTRLTPGTVVFVPATTGKDHDPDVPAEEIVVVPPGRFAEPGRRRVFYRTLAGDQLTEVAAAFGAAPSELARWNGLDPTAKLQAGMSLQAFVPLSSDLSRVRHLGEHEVRVLITGTEEFFEFFEAQNGRKRLFVRAAKGETLATIGKRYKMSAGMMERINRLPASTVIPEGDTVVVYAPSGTDGASAALDVREPLAAIQPPAPDALPKVAPGALPASPNGARAVPGGDR